MSSQSIAIIGGCGHVGLPLGLAFAHAGHQVNLIDINEKSVKLINDGQLPFLEEGAEALLKRVIHKKLWATTDISRVKEATVVVFVTGTPVDEYLNPRVHDVVQVVREYLSHLNKDALIVLRSTVYPGVVEMVDKLVREHFGKSKVAFCPERIAQGKGIEEIFKLPQIVSATSDAAFQEAKALFETLAPKIIPLEPKEAELTKLIANSWRYLDFAIANQFYMMVEGHGVDFYRIYEALTTDYPRAKHFAKPGLAAGPCLFKDTMQLSAFHKNQYFLGQSAMLVNEGLPMFLVEQMEQKLGSLKDKKIAILGMTFKANNDDVRASLSFKLKKVLESKMAVVIPSDIFLKHTVSYEEAVSKADGVILGVPHTPYVSLKLNKPYVDCWGVWERNEGLQAELVGGMGTKRTFAEREVRSEAGL